MGDPSEGMQFLRDYIDLRNCLNADYFSSTSTETKQGTLKRVRSASLEKLTQEYVDRVRRDLRITKDQVIRCYECLKLETIDKTNADAYKAYRLDVKRRLHKLIQERSAVFQVDQHTMRSMLHKEYQEVEANYHTLLTKIRKDTSKKQRHSYPTR